MIKGKSKLVHATLAFLPYTILHISSQEYFSCYPNTIQFSNEKNVYLQISINNFRKAIGRIKCNQRRCILKLPLYFLLRISAGRGTRVLGYPPVHVRLGGPGLHQRTPLGLAKGLPRALKLGTCSIGLAGTRVPASPYRRVPGSLKVGLLPVLT